MNKHLRLLLSAASALLAVCSSSAQTATLYGIGDLAGGTTSSEVRDVTKVGSTLHAVGSSNDGNSTAVYWTSSGTLTALPDLVANTGGTTAIIASAITPDAAYIAGRAYNASSGNTRQSARFDTSNLSSALNLGGPSAGSAVAISDNGNLLYGFASLSGVNRAYRYTVAGSAADAIGLLGGKTYNVMTARAASSDGSIALGNASTNTSASGAGNQAFIYDNSGAGSVTAVGLLSGGTWNQSLALNDAGTLGLYAGDSTSYSTGSEAFLFNGTTTTTLGAPGAGLLPNIFGGMTNDGSVIALSWFNASDDSSAGSFIYNSSGWHNFGTIASGSGANLTGWSDFSLFGISADGTLVWGSATHNGNTEGYIMEFSSGYLSSIPEPSTYAAFAGLAALGLAAWRRRKARAA